MNKNDLKTGMIVETRDERRFLVVREKLNTKIYGKQELVFIGAIGFICGDRYGEDLKAFKYPKHDIVKVYIANVRALYDMIRDDNLELIWERK